MHKMLVTVINSINNLYSAILKVVIAVACIKNNFHSVKKTNKTPQIVEETPQATTFLEPHTSFPDHSNSFEPSHNPGICMLLPVPLHKTHGNSGGKQG